MLIDGQYNKQRFESKQDVWDVIELIIEETKEANMQGSNFNIAESVLIQLPFFACTDIFLNKQSQKDIARFVYAKDFNVPAYDGSYGQQPSKWVEKSFLLKSIIEQQKSKVMNDGSN